MTATAIAVLVLIGLLAGIASGFVGIGGGLVMVPALVFFLGYSQHHAQGTSLGVLVLPVVFLAVWNYNRSQALDVRTIGIIAASFVFGAYLGSKWAIALPADVVKKVFGTVMIVAALKLIFGK